MGEMMVSGIVMLVLTWSLVMGGVFSSAVGRRHENRRLRNADGHLDCFRFVQHTLMKFRQPIEVTMANDKNDGICRVLSLDGGGAKGFYTLGVLKEIEGMIGCSLWQRFDLIFGTSTGSIIGSLLALGKTVDEVHDSYRRHVVSVVTQKNARCKSAALESLSKALFGDTTFDAVKTGVGVVATRWLTEKPMIFKAHVEQAYGRKGTFAPGFGVKLGDAIQASCSAYPFFLRKVVRTSDGDEVELIDGGFCANNPTLYAIADATVALKFPHEGVRVVSVGVGQYPDPKKSPFSGSYWISKLMPVQLLQKTLEINTQSMDQLRAVLFSDVPTVRISDTYEEPEMAADLFEADLKKLNMLRQRGRESFAKHEATLQEFLL